MIKISVKKLGILAALVVGLLGVSLVAHAQDPAPETRDRDAGRFEELETAAKNLANMTKEERTEFINQVKKYLKETNSELIKKDFTLAERIAKDMQRLESTKPGALYVDFGVLLNKSSKKEVAQLGESLAGMGRKLDLKGSQMVVFGKTVEDKEFELKSYRGKVVLVDFWATWCPPCVKEMPYLLKTHARYKDRGFDIVGISFDRSLAPLERFIETKKVPWTNIYDQKQDMARFYNVTGIPFTVLIDQEGTVLAVDPSHAELTRLLEKHLPPAKDDQ